MASKTYEDRKEAGAELASALRENDVEPDRVLGIPRGALPVARPVADEFDVPLDAAIAKKLSHPDDSDVAIGAVSADGTYWLSDEALDRFDLSQGYIDEAVERQRETVEEKLDRYCGGDPPGVEGETVVLVDDGAATGATAYMGLRYLAEAEADRVVLAVPVSSEMAIETLEPMADTVVCPLVPSDFESVWEYYDVFEQVPDEEALSYL